MALALRQYFGTRQDHIPGALIKAQEAAEVNHGQDLFAHVQDLSRRTIAILEQAELANDPKTALSAIREARGDSELLAEMIVAMETVESAKDEERAQEIKAIEIVLVNPDGTRGRSGDE
jgi:hypothetical protein